MNPRILVIGQLPPPHHGSNVMAEIFIKSLKNAGCDTTIIEKKFSDKIEDVRIFSIKKILKIPRISAQLISHLVRKEYDLCFYFLTIQPPSIFVDMLFLIIIRIFGVDYIPYLHVKGFIRIGDILAQPLQYLFKKIISHSLGTVVLGERLKADVNSLIPDKNIFVLPNAVHDINYHNINRNYHNNGIVKVLFLSNLMPSKGPIDFLEIAKKLKRIHKKVHFYLAGPKMSNKFFSEIKQFIETESLKNIVTLTGPIYGEKKNKMFMESDIFVFPTHDEVFGLVNLEAMRAGLPIVTTNEGSIPEIVIDGLNGFIVDPKDIDMLADRVQQLIFDQNLRNKMGHASREIYKKKFTLEQYQYRLEQGLAFFSLMLLRRGSKKARLE